MKLPYISLFYQEQGNNSKKEIQKTGKQVQANLYVHTPRELDRRVTHRSLEASARWPICPILGFWGAKFPKM